MCGREQQANVESHSRLLGRAIKGERLAAGGRREAIKSSQGSRSGLDRQLLVCGLPACCSRASCVAEIDLIVVQDGMCFELGSVTSLDWLADSTDEQEGCAIDTQEITMLHSTDRCSQRQ